VNKDFIISWKAAGISLGLLLILATALVQPLGVSSQFVVTDAIVAHQMAPEFAEGNEYLSKYGEKDAWGVGYGWMLVLGMIVGGGLTARLLRKRQPEADKGSMPELWTPMLSGRRSSSAISPLLLAACCCCSAPASPVAAPAVI
jgi:MFS family permease